MSKLIEDLKIESIVVKNDNLDKINDMLNEYKINIYDYLPKKNAHKVSFVINESSTFANFIRASIWDGVKVWSLKVETSTIQSSDPFMLFDDLEQKIHGIPINQTFLNNAYNKDGETIYKKFRGSFSVFNNTTQLRTITTSDMKFTYNETPIEYMCSSIPIFKLQPGKQLSLEMTIEQGYGYQDANKFNPVDAREYKILDFKHMSQGGPSSLEYNPKKFYLSYTTYRNYEDPLELLHIIIDDNTDRLKKMIDKVKTFDESKLTILHDIETNFIRYDTQTHYHTSESYFLAGAISRIIYDLNNDIELVTYDAKHLLEHSSFIIVQSEKANEQVINACQVLIEKLSEMKKIINKL